MFSPVMSVKHTHSQSLDVVESRDIERDVGKTDSTAVSLNLDGKVMKSDL